MRLTFYKLMDILDKFCLDSAEEYDFRDLTVHCNKVLDKEFVFIKNDNKIVLVIILDDN